MILLEKVFFYFFFLNIIKKNIKGQQSILELGAGVNSYIRQLDNSIKITAVDLFEPSIQFSLNNKLYDFFIIGDVNNLTDYVPQKSFDTVVAFDLIEHLTKEDGLRLIENMIMVAKHNIIIYTPNGFLPQPSHGNNPFQEHISGWTFNEMKKLGFNVYGIYGHKKLRKIYALPTIKPYFIGNFISNLSMLFLRLFNREDLSFSILCIKTV